MRSSTQTVRKIKAKKSALKRKAKQAKITKKRNKSMRKRKRLGMR